MMSSTALTAKELQDDEVRDINRDELQRDELRNVDCEELQDDELRSADCAELRATRCPTTAACRQGAMNSRTLRAK